MVELNVYLYTSLLSLMMLASSMSSYFITCKLKFKKVIIAPELAIPIVIFLIIFLVGIFKFLTDLMFYSKIETQDFSYELIVKHIIMYMSASAVLGSIFAIVVEKIERAMSIF